MYLICLNPVETLLLGAASPKTGRLPVAVSGNEPALTFLSSRGATILDKINGTSGPLPPISMMPKWRGFAPSRLHHCFGCGGGEGG